MKNLKLLLCIAVLFLAITPIYAQDKTPQTVIIKTFELFIGKESQMVVTSPDGTSKNIQLQNVDSKNYAIGTGNNNAIVQSEIDRWKKQGFEIEGLSTTVSGALLLTTIILSKDE